MNLLHQLYAALLYLYPREFRDEFGDEMQSVFADSMAEVAARGRWALARVWLRELRDMPCAALRERWRSRKGEMTMNSQNGDQVTRAQSLAGVGIFLFYPFMLVFGFTLIMAFGALAPFFGNLSFPKEAGNIIASVFVLSILAAFVITLTVAWRDGFPRWSFPYWAIVVLLSWYTERVTTPGLWVFGYTFGPNDLWGWRAWIPLALVVALALMWTRSLRPFAQLIRGVWQDWTRLSFAVYGIVPFWLLGAFDETRGGELLMALLWGILAVGAFAYLRVVKNWQRILALVVSAVFSFSAAAVYLALYWNGRQEFWMSVPADGWAQVRSLAPGALTLLMYMLSPALLGVLEQTTHRLRPAKK